MFSLQLIAALAVAIVLSAVMVLVFRWQRPGVRGYWTSALYLFSLLFVASWAGGVWAAPFGPEIGGVYWLPFLIAGAIFSLLLLGVVPFRRPDSPEEAERQAEISAGVGGILHVAFWLLLAALAIVIIAHYF